MQTGIIPAQLLTSTQNQFNKRPETPNRRQQGGERDKDDSDAVQWRRSHCSVCVCVGGSCQIFCHNKPVDTETETGSACMDPGGSRWIQVLLLHQIHQQVQFTADNTSVSCCNLRLAPCDHMNTDTQSDLSFKGFSAGLCELALHRAPSPCSDTALLRCSVNIQDQVNNNKYS